MFAPLPEQLDVDDLEEIGDLEGYIDRSQMVLVYCSKGYFASRNCMRELVATVTLDKAIIALIDTDLSHGGLTMDQIHRNLLLTDQLAEDWGFKQFAESPRQCVEWHGEYVWPTALLLREELFKHGTIEWNRIGHFQDGADRVPVLSCASCPCPCPCLHVHVSTPVCHARPRARARTRTCL